MTGGANALSAAALLPCALEELHSSVAYDRRLELTQSILLEILENAMLLRNWSIGGGAPANSAMGFSPVDVRLYTHHVIFSCTQYNKSCWLFR